MGTFNGGNLVHRLESTVSLWNVFVSSCMSRKKVKANAQQRHANTESNAETAGVAKRAKGDIDNVAVYPEVKKVQRSRLV